MFHFGHVTLSFLWDVAEESLDCGAVTCELSGPDSQIWVGARRAERSLREGYHSVTTGGVPLSFCGDACLSLELLGVMESKLSKHTYDFSEYSFLTSNIFLYQLLQPNFLFFVLPPALPFLKDSSYQGVVIFTCLFKEPVFRFFKL